MTPLILLVMAAGVSEAAGRLLPLVSRRPGMSRASAVGLLLTGGMVEAAVIALWPVTAQALAELVSPISAGAPALAWTAGSVAPLLLTAVLAFPLLGPPLHLLLLVGVGAGLAGTLAATSGMDWEVAAISVAVAGFALAAAVDVVRRVVGRFIAAGARGSAA